MKMDAVLILGILAVVLAGAMFTVGCTSGSEPSTVPGPAEKAGAALDKAVEKTSEAAKQTAEATKDAASKAAVKTGEALEKVGSAMEKTGTDMKANQSTPVKP